MFWKKASGTEKKLQQMNDILKKSFSNVKSDTTNIFQWLNYFYRKSLQQEQLIKELKLELSYIPKTREDIRKIIDDYYSFESVMGRIRDVSVKVEELIKREHVTKESTDRTTPLGVVHPEVPKELQFDISSIQRRLDKLEQKKLSMKEKIIKRLVKNSKEYVKSVILSYIKKYERISALQLREMVVDEQNFCSKSSFYRLLEELEQLEDVGVIKQGKEKHYISKAVKKV